jgi:hypothetical protein
MYQCLRVFAFIDFWEADYNTMVESMIYEKNPPTFAQLIETLEQLRVQLQQVSWDFDLKFFLFVNNDLCNPR